VGILTSMFQVVGYIGINTSHSLIYYGWVTMQLELVAMATNPAAYLIRKITMLIDAVMLP